jgi:hypothetical protein
LWSYAVIVGGMGMFVPVVMVVEREDATGACCWKGLPTRTLASYKLLFSIYTQQIIT